MPKGYEHLVILGAIAVAVWLLATYLYPRLMLIAYKRAILVKGVDSGPIPVNTLYTQPQALFRDPFAPLPPGGSRLMSMGTNRDTLYVAGWLDLSKGPLVLHVPDMRDRYYSVQFTDSATNTNFAYIGTRTTGTASGDYLVSGPRWTGLYRTAWDMCPRRAMPSCSLDACSSQPTTTSRPLTPSPRRFASCRGRPRQAIPNEADRPLEDEAHAASLWASLWPHWPKIWSTNPLVRLNKEIKRRARVVGIFPTRQR